MQEIDNNMTTPSPNKRANVSWAGCEKESKKTKLDINHLPCRVVSYEKNTNFVGRLAALDELTALLLPSEFFNPQKQISVQLCGAGGVGKTQVALSFVFTNWNTYQAILVASAKNEESLLASYAKFAYKLGLVPSSAEDQKKSASLATSWFEHAMVPWLIVFDNFDGGPGSDFLLEYWPKGEWGSVLVTARNKEALSPFPGTIMMLDSLTEPEAIELLFRTSRRTRSSIEEESAKQITSMLGYLPLGIVNAGSSIKVAGWTFKDYKAFVNPAEVIRNSKPLRGFAFQYPYTLHTVWNIELSRLKEEPGALALFYVIAFLHSDIHEDLLSMAKPGTKPDEFKVQNPPHVEFQKHFVKFRARLARSGLAFQTKTPNGNQFHVHRLFQERCHLEMSSQEKQEAFDTALFLIRFAWPIPERTNRPDPALWEMQQICAPHIASIKNFYKLSHDPDAPQYSSCPIRADRSFAQMLYDVGWYHYERGNIKLSLEFLREAKDWCDTNPYGCELLTADIWGAVGYTSIKTNKPSTALEGFRRQFIFLEKARDMGQWSRPNMREAIAFGDLGNGYYGLDMYAEAEKHYRITLEFWQDNPGDNVYAIHLGTCLTLQEKWEEAETIFLQTIYDRRQRFGVRHTNSYRSGLLWLAYGNLLARQQRTFRALEAYTGSLEIWKNMIGDDHHRIADLCYKIGWGCYLSRLHKIAIKALEQALDIFDMDPLYRNESARTKFALSLVHTAMETMIDIEKANRYLQEAEQIRKERLGERWSATCYIGINDYDILVESFSR